MGSNGVWPAESEKNPSLLLHNPHDLRPSNRPVPQPTTPHDVLVRIAYVGCCGSDVHFWHHGGMSRKVSPTNPIVMGHEASGTIVAVGASVTSLRPGDAVAIEPGYPCRRCRPCKEGRYNLCKLMRFAAAPGGIAAGVEKIATHGTLCKYFRIPEDFCYKLGDGVGLDEAVLVEPLAVAVHANRLADVRSGQQVVVMGSGTIGLFCAAVARAFGAAKVVVVDVLERKLAFAEGFVPGVRTFIPPTTKPEEGVDPDDVSQATAARMVDELDLGDGADVVLEATGAEPCIQTGVHVLKSGGTLVQAGLGKARMSFPVVRMSEKELTVKGCFRYGAGDFELALQLMREGKVSVKPLISSEVPFEQASEAWERTGRGEGIKNLIRGVQD
ncbi:D-xylulose reductase [Lasiodiplodia hormozganensis]|uniref:D-xylulose reductase n=1 Tax=Lasiodiplodia hormozganensis TaxID=869390 RepID=A0AA39Y889_9PEZI|nr:D-xylulose reductase [Lasiodiplodia hormozganensis]